MHVFGFFSLQLRAKSTAAENLEASNKTEFNDKINQFTFP